MEIKILKYHFQHPEAKTSLRLNRANELLTECFATTQSESTALSANEGADMPPLPSLGGDPTEAEGDVV